MNRYGRGGGRIGGGGPSKATPSTLCQKCLKKGHYSYECKEPRTERPYVSRPSRTQQLFNPKLAPKLMSDEAKDLLRKKGVADEELAKKEAERNRIRDHDIELDDTRGRGITSKRERSASIASSTSTRSISSYSSNSRSRSPPMRQSLQSKQISKHHEISPRMEPERKRRRGSPSSDEEDSEQIRRISFDSERRTRRRFSDASPEARGRRRSIGPSGGRSAQRQASRSPVRGGSERYRRVEDEEYERETEVLAHKTTDRRDERKFSGSQVDRVTRDSRGRRQSNDDERYGATYKNNDDHRRSASPPPARPSQPARERSLSPFSKRLALTRAMAGGGR